MPAYLLRAARRKYRRSLLRSSGDIVDPAWWIRKAKSLVLRGTFMSWASRQR